MLAPNTIDAIKSSLVLLSLTCSNDKNILVVLTWSWIGRGGDYSGGGESQLGLSLQIH